MPKFSKKSINALQTCEDSIIIVMKELIKYVDFSVVYGHRTVSQQQKLYGKGRIKTESGWFVEDEDAVVTYCDGLLKLSNHNYMPSRAIDITPYPTGWGSKINFYYLAGTVMLLSDFLYDRKKISYHLKWGGDWDRDKDFQDQRFYDLAHFEIIKSTYQEI